MDYQEVKRVKNQYQSVPLVDEDGINFLALKEKLSLAADETEKLKIIDSVNEFHPDEEPIIKLQYILLNLHNEQETDEKVVKRYQNLTRQLTYARIFQMKRKRFLLEQERIKEQTSQNIKGSYSQEISNSPAQQISQKISSFYNYMVGSSRNAKQEVKEVISLDVELKDLKNLPRYQLVWKWDIED